jgi:GntR family transcriptional regulator
MMNKLTCFIQPNSGEPIYQQRVRQLKHVIATGALQPGDQLPTVRELAEQLVINPNTVARAYRELFTAGLVEGTQGAGTFVKARSRVMKTTERESRIQPFIDQLVSEATLLGFDKRDIVRLVQRSIREREEELHDHNERSHQKIR